MDIELFAGIAVTDFDRAIDWYERLLGTPSTFTAHDTEQVWTVVEHASIAVDLDPEHARAPPRSRCSSVTSTASSRRPPAATSPRPPARPTTTASARCSSTTPTATRSASAGHRWSRTPDSGAAGGETDRRDRAGARHRHDRRRGVVPPRDAGGPAPQAHRRAAVRVAHHRQLAGVRGATGASRTDVLSLVAIGFLVARPPTSSRTGPAGPSASSSCRSSPTG